jgi:hypothetical protein
MPFGVGLFESAQTHGVSGAFVLHRCQGRPIQWMLAVILVLVVGIIRLRQRAIVIGYQKDLGLSQQRRPQRTAARAKYSRTTYRNLSRPRRNSVAADIGPILWGLNACGISCRWSRAWEIRAVPTPV